MTTPVDDALPLHVRENRAYWDAVAPRWVEAGERAWASAEPYWGVWRLPEAEVRMLPRDLDGLDAIELGCGTGYVAGWMARRGAHVVAIDNAERQLETARRLAAAHGVSVTWIHGNAEAVPCPDASFDFAISEYGAALWCDPHVWIPEAHRLLRPEGELVFLASHPLATITTPPSGAMSEDRLHRDYFGLHRTDWTQVAIDPGGVEFTLPISSWFDLFRRTGFDVLGYLELRAPPDADGTPFHSPAAWARRWPYEHVWKLRRRA